MPTPEEIIEQARREVQAARQGQRSAEIASERGWQLAFLGLLGGIVLGLLLWPGAPLDQKLAGVGHGICGQIHIQALGGLNLPICARNTGIYGGFATTLLLLVFGLGRRRAAKLPPLPITILLLLFIAVMGVDGVNSLLLDLFLPHLYTPMNWLRTLTGTGMGITIAVLLLLVINLALRKDLDLEQRIVRGWGEFALILGVNLAVVAAIYANIGLLYWPVALLSTVGIVGVLYCVNLLVVALLLNYENQVTRAAQLARPGTIALVTTLLMVGGLAYLRFWLEGRGMM